MDLTTPQPGDPHMASRAAKDACDLLDADHRNVKKMFKEYEELSGSRARSATQKKMELARQICMELTVHAQIEEEIFYPALRGAIKDTDLLDEATVEHQSAKDLIAQIEQAGEPDEMFDAKVKVLGEYIDHHPWLGAVAVLAVMLGVALAFSVHLINQSALAEFSSAVRATSGEPDIELRGSGGRIDEKLFARVAAHEQVTLANPVLEFSTFAIGASGQRRPLRVVGLDVLAAASLSPSLMPALAPGEDRLDLFAPAVVFLNAAARTLAGDAQALRVQTGLVMREARIAGSVAAGGPALAVMDIG